MLLDVTIDINIINVGHISDKLWTCWLARLRQKTPSLTFRPPCFVPVKWRGLMTIYYNSGRTGKLSDRRDRWPTDQPMSGIGAKATRGLMFGCAVLFAKPRGRRNQSDNCMHEWSNGFEFRLNIVHTGTKTVRAALRVDTNYAARGCPSA